MRLFAREGCRTGRQRVAAGRGCKNTHGRRKHTFSFCVYVCLGVCVCGGRWVGGGLGGGRGEGRGVEGACKDARVTKGRTQL